MLSFFYKYPLTTLYTCISDRKMKNKMFLQQRKYGVWLSRVLLHVNAF